MSTHVEVQAGDGGVAELRVDGYDVSRFASAAGIDLRAGEPPRVVLEGRPSLRATLESAEVEYRAVPPLTREELDLLREAAEAHEVGEEGRRRLRGALERLERILGDER